jgi:4-methylaminobutanoate oxidase (formaldehyde-forming)
MINKANVIVIGSGGLGAATAYYLSQRKRLSLALIDKARKSRAVRPAW